MTRHVADLVFGAATRWPDRPAMRYDGAGLTYGALAKLVSSVAAGLRDAGLRPGERVAVYLEKRIETVAAMFGAVAAGGVFVPINPLLKARQVGYILRDCNVRLLVSSDMRLQSLASELAECPDLHGTVTVDGEAAAEPNRTWAQIASANGAAFAHPVGHDDKSLAAILYTSGSTGMPKGVMLSHRNLCLGGESVSSYLGNTPEDRILAALPLSFDAGLSQLTTAFHVGACVVLMNYLFPKDVVRLCAAEGITGLTAVPPLWIQIAQLEWPAEAARRLRYFANTGGHMPRATLDRLRAIFTEAKPYLMYGLTEAFRSTYLDPAQVDTRPSSIGKAIPNAEILVLRPDGSVTDPEEVGELVHCGPLVSLGYWNDAERTAQRFRPVPGRLNPDGTPEIAVWSGDRVKRDSEGFLYFVGRGDDMIKTSGYRVSPTELEETVYASGLVGEVVALGLPHPVLGQAIVLVVTPPVSGTFDANAFATYCRGELPAYMVPQRVVERLSLPRNPNGKIDRKVLASELTLEKAEVAS